MDFGEPFWDESTYIPNLNEKIGRYTILSSLYSTRYALYYLCHDSLENDNKFIKFIKFTKEKINNIENEVKITKEVDFPNIIKLSECFRHNAYVCLVFPYSHRQTLFDYIQNQYPDGIPEKLASYFMKQMLSAVGYLHNLHIWHRNIKPENFFISDGDHPKILLGNFEFAQHFEKGEKGTKYLGTFEFMAPEIINQVPYDSSIDMWSLGITLFVMLTGRFPFPRHSTSPQEFNQRVSKGLLNYDIINVQKVSSDAVDLIHQMCKFNSTDRITVHEALAHNWFVTNNTDDDSNKILTSSEEIV